ncbi:MAG: SLBB domain-containing protein [Bacteroidales bacterium]|nr:SLBB domain-containing protein [Bacteroidales bacterium]
MKFITTVGKIKSLSICIILTLLFISIGVHPIMAQIPSGAIMIQVNAELQKRGLTEIEVRERLINEGIDIDNIQPAEYPNYQTQVMQILDALETEKKKAKLFMPDTVIPLTPKEEPKTTTEEAVAEQVNQAIAEKTVEKVNLNGIYGHSLFKDQSLDVFRTTDGAQAPDTYILGIGDEIRISIFGTSQTDLQLKINDKGFVQPAGMSKIFLQGFSLKTAKELLRERLSKAYTFRSDQFAITISTARTIMINIFGETKNTGGFTISALNSAFNALSAAGGPTEIGSVRNIQIIRDGDREILDLYEFMNDPIGYFKFDLQQNDVIYVPVVQNVVTIEGAVRRPMQYEMKPNEQLNDLILFAGGLNVDANPGFVQIQRYTNGEIQLLEYNLGDVVAGSQKIGLTNGDIVRIKSIQKPIDEYVEIVGSVYYPGRYSVESNSSLKQLLSNAQPTLQAKLDVVVLNRLRSDETVEIITIPWKDLLIAELDFELLPRDVVTLSDLARYRDVSTISVSGHVRMPYEKTFSLADSLNVVKALELAGGIKTSAYPVAYVYRRSIYNPEKLEYIRIKLEDADQFVLKPGDELKVFDNTLFTNIGEVSMFGAVKNPQRFTFDPSLTIRDLLTASGGFAYGAELNRIEVFRTILTPNEDMRLELITLQVDSDFQLLSPKEFTLQPYDQIVVRQIPGFEMGRSIEITGEIKYPGVYVLESKQVKLSEIIDKAGGLMEGADAKGSQLFRTFNKRGNITLNVDKAMKFSGDLRFDPYLFSGDVIHIARRENTVAIRPLGTRLIASETLGGQGSLNLVFQGGKSAKWYINNYAGGFDKKADKNSVTVSLKNGQVKTTKKFLLVFRKYPHVETGSMISLQMKPPKEEKKEKKEEVDWGRIWANSLSGITTALTIYLLTKQVNQ